MVRIEDLQMEEHLDDFYRDGARFKNMKLLIDFNQVNLKVETPSFDPGKPKFKKKQTTIWFHGQRLPHWVRRK